MGSQHYTRTRPEAGEVDEQVRTFAGPHRDPTDLGRRTQRAPVGSDEGHRVTRVEAEVQDPRVRRVQDPQPVHAPLYLDGSIGDSVGEACVAEVAVHHVRAHAGGVGERLTGPRAPISQNERKLERPRREVEAGFLVTFDDHQTGHATVRL